VAAAAVFGLLPSGLLLALLLLLQSLLLSVCFSVLGFLPPYCLSYWFAMPMHQFSDRLMPTFVRAACCLLSFVCGGVRVSNAAAPPPLPACPAPTLLLPGGALP
jgi:hypothetical protein